MKQINICFVIVIIFLTLKINSVQIDIINAKKDNNQGGELNFLELSRKNNNLIRFSSSLRENHLQNISEMQTYLLDMTQLKTANYGDTNAVKHQLKLFFLKLEQNIDNLNKK